MSVYRPRKKDGGFASPFWHYDFQRGGRRFHGSTGKTTRREASEVEGRKKLAAKAAGDESTIAGAFGRFWLEVGQHDGDPDTTFYRLERLQDGLTAILGEAGQPAKLAGVTENEIARYVARRRAEKTRHGGTPAPATINRELQLLRRVMRRAANVWKHAIPLPSWKGLLLTEPEEHIVDVPPDVEERVLGNMREDFRPVARFLVMTGLREGSVLASPSGHGPLRPEAVDFEAGVITVKTKSRKPGGKTHRLPVPQAVKVLLANEIGKHPDAVFTYVAKATRDGRRHGRCYPITKTAFYSEFKRAADGAGYPDLRPHDLRHTAGNRVLAATGNMRLAQKVLGHSRISTTQKYTHPDLDAVREAMEAAHDSAESRKSSRKAH